MFTLHRNASMNSPFSLFDALFEGNDPLAAWSPRRSSWVGGPTLELSEEDERYTIVGDLPGVRAEDLDVAVKDGLLTISGRRNVDAPEGYETRRTERSTLEFERSYRLGDRIEPQGVEAKLVDGVLTLSLPKRAELKPRRIAIQSA